MTGRPLLWSPAHPAVVDADGHRFHRLWCPDVRDHGEGDRTYVDPSQALMWEDAPGVCATCRSQNARG